jgi:hypothetical protein
MNTSNPAKLYAALVGATLVVAGLIGFAYSTSFGSPGEVDAVFGLLNVNAWHNLVHIATGALGLAAIGYAARQYALGLGVVYVAVAIWGFALGSGESILGVIPINTEDNVLHLLLGLTGIAAGLATPVARRPRAEAATAQG